MKVLTCEESVCVLGGRRQTLGGWVVEELQWDARILGLEDLRFFRPSDHENGGIQWCFIGWLEARMSSVDRHGKCMVLIQNHVGYDGK